MKWTRNNKYFKTKKYISKANRKGTITKSF